MTSRTFRPDHKVTLRRYDDKAKAYLDAEDISDDVVSITTNKAYGRAAGGFQITTTFKLFKTTNKRYDEIVKPDDIVQIYLDAGDGTGMQSVMVGLVDRVGRVRAYDGNGNPQYRCRINGTDFGKLLLKHNCIMDISPLKDTENGLVVGGDNTAYLIRLAKGVEFTGTPKKFVQTVFDQLFKGQLTLPTTYMDVSFPDLAIDDWMTYCWPVLESTGSVWNVMKATANEPFNVVTTETYGDKLLVIMEKYPFHPETGKLLCGQPFIRGLMHDYRDKDDLLVSEDLGLADNERVNYVYLHAPQFVIAGATESMPVAFAQGIFNSPVDELKLHGFAKWDVTTSFGPPSFDAQGGPNPNSAAAFAPIRERAQMLWNRVKNNHLMESGNLSIHGAPQIKTGEGLLLANGNEYFIEQVSHNYQILTERTVYQTSLGVTRGQKHE